MANRSFASVSNALHLGENFHHLEDAPWYGDSVYPSFSETEYRRRHGALREAMRAQGLDCLIVPGSMNNASMGYGMVWLTGHLDARALAQYVVFPLEGEPTLLCSMGGAHIWATRKAVCVKNVRAASGNFGNAMAECILGLDLARGRIGLASANSEGRANEYLPANYYLDLRKQLPEAELLFIPEILHPLMMIKSEEERAYVRKAGALCDRAIEAIAGRAAPGVAEYQLAASAAFAIQDGGGYVHLNIIGSTAMQAPALPFGNPRPSGRTLRQGDVVLNELAAGYFGYTAQIGAPICLGSPSDAMRRLHEEVAIPVFERIEACLHPGGTVEEVQEAGQFILEKGYTSRPTLIHGIDIVTCSPLVEVAHIRAKEADRIFRPGMVIMSEPNPITPDGRLGSFIGRTYIITENGHERVTNCPLELISI
ncbi:MAG: M24 family metallopeptidase [bacterium]|nr:M24 family metallopeptidase [bacterium]